MGQLGRWNVIRIAAAIFAIAVIGVAHANIPVETTADRGESFVPRPAVAKAFALGFDAVLSDFYWLQAVQIVGGENRDPSRHAKHLGRLIDVVTTLDPWVDHPYRFAIVWMTDSEESVREANRLMRRGIEYHPDDWRNHFNLGFNHFFYLEEHAEAAEALDRAVSLEGAPRYLPRLVARLRSHSNDLESAGLFLEQLVSNSADPAERAEYQKALDEIEIEHKARSLDRAREAFRQLHGRDIRSVDELARGRGAVLDRLPNPEPSSLPGALKRGSRWTIDVETDRIVSSYYGRRYELNMQVRDRERNERWRRLRNHNEGPGNDDA